MHVGEVPIDRALVERLVAAHHPELSREPVREVRSTGTVNAIFRVGEEHCVRLPRLPEWADALRRECAWLPWLAPQLILRQPEPVFLGEPTDEYPLPWAIFRWLEGEPYGRVWDERPEAETLGRFVTQLHALPVPADAPRGGRAPLAELDDVTRAALESDAGVAAWDRALQAPVWDGVPTWAHNDLLGPNLLTVDGALAAVIDWGSVGVGDPAQDLVPAWAIFSPLARRLFRKQVGADDGTWERARGYALHQAALIIPYYRTSNPAFTAMAERTVAEIIRE